MALFLGFAILFLQVQQLPALRWHLSTLIMVVGGRNFGSLGKLFLLFADDGWGYSHLHRPSNNLLRFFDTPLVGAVMQLRVLRLLQWEPMHNLSSHFHHHIGDTISLLTSTLCCWRLIPTSDSMHMYWQRMQAALIAAISQLHFEVLEQTHRNQQVTVQASSESQWPFLKWLRYPIGVFSPLGECQTIRLSAIGLVAKYFFQLSWSIRFPTTHIHGSR